MNVVLRITEATLWKHHNCSGQAYDLEKTATNSTAQYHLYTKPSPAENKRCLWYVKVALLNIVTPREQTCERVRVILSRYQGNPCVAGSHACNLACTKFMHVNNGNQYDISIIKKTKPFIIILRVSCTSYSIFDILI